MGMIDFTDCALSVKGYDGADKKKAVLYGGKLYLLKFPTKRKLVGSFEQKEVDTHSPLSEHLGSLIFKSVSINAQNTLLGYYSDGGDRRTVVACEDFLGMSENKMLQLLEFSKASNNVMSKNFYNGVELTDLNIILHEHDFVKHIETKAKEAFWDMYVVDALIANMDRHLGNWGYIADLKTNGIDIAPIYDCGGSLFYRWTEEEIEDALSKSSRKEIDELILFEPISSAIKIDGNIVSPNDYIAKLENEDLNKAITRIVPKISMDKIKDIVHRVRAEFCSDRRKEFLSILLTGKYEKILLPAYQKLA
jgi:hypothetical protein